MMETEALFEEFRMQELSRKITELFPALSVSPQTLCERLLAGDLFGFFGDCFRLAISQDIDLAGLKSLFVTILMLGMAGAVYLRVTELMDKFHVSEIAFYFVYLLQAAVLVKVFGLLERIAAEALEGIVTFVKLLLPTYLFSVGIATGSVTAGAGCQMLLFLIYGVEEFLEGVFLPFISCFFLMTVLEGMQSQDRMEYLLELMAKVFSWGMKGALGAVAGMGFLQAMLTPAIDSVKGSAFQRIVAALPGIGSGAQSVLELACGSAVVIKNSVGILLLVLLLLYGITPLTELLAVSFLLKLSAALVGIVSDKRLSKGLDRAGQTGLFFFRVTGCAMLYFMIAIAATLASVKR